MTADTFYTVLASFYCLTFKNISAREREVTPSTIHAVVRSVKLHWHLGIFNFILRLTLCKRNPQLLKSGKVGMRNLSIVASILSLDLEIRNIKWFPCFHNLV